MKKTVKINLMGFTFSALAIAASSAMISGCGQAPNPTRPAGVVPGAQARYPYVPIYSAPQSINTINDINQQSATQQAQTNALVGTYAGTISVIDNDGNYLDQPYTVVVSKGTDQGKTVLKSAFTSGNIKFTATTQAICTAPYIQGGNWFCTLTSIPQIVSNIDTSYPVSLQLNLELTPQNQVALGSSRQNNDPAVPPIRIGETGLYQGVDGDPVYFNDDLVKR